MKRIFLLTAASLAFPLVAMAQSNDSMTTTGTATPGTATNGTMSSGATTSGGTATDASPAGTSMSGSSTMGKLSMQDTHFIKTAAISGMAEVADGQLAASMGDSTIKSIGTQMVTDHTKANDQLMTIATQKGVTPPAKVDATHAMVTAQLKKLSGARFDKKYLSTELKGHETTIAAFKTEASTGSDPDLKSFASNTLPTLEQHLSMIKAAMK